MKIYAIGDVQGCYNQLEQLLNQINFDPKNDKLWFTGDLVNRGPDSLKTLRFVKSLGDAAITVLGNHDLALLAKAHGFKAVGPKDTISEVLAAPDCASLLDWLRCRPLLHYDKQLGYALVHAGIPPMWDIQQAISMAKELEKMLVGEQYKAFLRQMYGNEPSKWDNGLTDFDRLRYIVNAFTRMRFCSKDGELNFTEKGSFDTAPIGFQAWFNYENRKTASVKVIFGHWAALKANVSMKNIYAVDGGCVWGNNLIAMRLNDNKYYKVSCS